MYFLNIKDLKADIKADKLSEKDRFRYVFIYIALGTLAMYGYANGFSNTWEVIESISFSAIVLLGTYFAYRANCAENGRDFLGRYFGISFVVGLRFFIFMLPLYILLFFYYFSVISDDGDIAMTGVDVAISMSLNILLYARIVKHMGDVRD